MRNRAPLSAALALALALAGCGGGSHKSASADSTTTSAPTTTSTTAPTTTTIDPVADKAAAAKMVLVKADIPNGWTDAPATADTGDDQAQDQLNACIGSPPAAQVQESRVLGDQFTQGYNEISSEADVEKSATQPQQDFAGITDSKNYACVGNILAAAVKESLGAQAASATVTTTMAPISDLTTATNEFGLRATITVKTPTNKGNLTEYIDIVGVSSGRYEAQFSTTNIQTPASIDLEKTLLSKLESHIKDATA